ncbi:hypothetical protein BaRGS_00005485 [Batillaria attramentaria]|uniref:Uncharacterized protein n=1 Tax=Batillaria attramentaria TaxID=370345 RepID=A0ABD0LVP4_9CAEN
MGKCLLRRRFTQRHRPGHTQNPAQLFAEQSRRSSAPVSFISFATPLGCHKKKAVTVSICRVVSAAERNCGYSSPASVISIFCCHVKMAPGSVS